MDTPAEELLKKIKSLEAERAQLRDKVSQLTISAANQHRRRRRRRVLTPPSSSGCQLKESECVSILEVMGRAVHMFDSDGRIFYWNCSAENLYGYSATEAIGRTICEILVTSRDVAFAELIIQRCSMGETWSGKFPVKHKMGRIFPVFATNTPLYDDDATFIGVICLTCDARQFKDIPVSIPDPMEEETGQDFVVKPRSFDPDPDPDPPLQTAIASKITNLASKVSNKLRSKMKIGDMVERREDGDSSPRSTPKGDLSGTPAGVFGSTAEAWVGKRTMQWSWKRTDCETLESPNGQFGWPRMQSRQDSNRAHSAAKVEIPTGDHISRPVAIEASVSVSSYNFDSSSSESSSESGSNSGATHKLDADTDSLAYEIIWEDLTVGEQIGHGACGTVYHGLWQGSDVAIKVFSKQEYSEEVVSSFREEVSLMKKFRHPNILLFMGAVTSSQRLCIVTEFLPRGSLFCLLQRSTSKLDSRRRLNMALDIARGMNYLHNCNPPIVHRDLKSSNLLVDKNWSVKVADFGLSRVKHETYLTTRTGKGTPQWMAPEVIQNERSNEKSDLYSFGVILWELATQKIPWENLNPMQVIGAVGFMNQRLDIPEDVDPTWASMIESCWRSEPQSRPTFRELLEKLKEMLKQYNLQSQAARATSSARPRKQV